MNNQKHLTLDSRTTIQTELNKSSSFKSIAKLLGKDCTNISKEVKNHICFEKSGCNGRPFNDCYLALSRQCGAHEVCSGHCQNPRRPCWSCGRYNEPIN